MAGWLVAAAVAMGPAVAPAAQDSGFGPQQMSRKEGALGTNGQVRDPIDQVDDHPARISEPDPFEDRAAEKSVAVPQPAPPPVARSVPAEVLALDTNMPTRISDVLACRLEIATDRRVKLQKVAAGTVLLRWTVQPGGGVSDAEVVARRNRTDPDVLSCARRKMESWVFIHGPDAEPLKIEQAISFE
jgi:hypothetical protein